MCERKLLDSMSIENAATLFHQADRHGAQRMRDHCLEFINREFDAVFKTTAFEELCHADVDLVVQLIKRRRVGS